jgi:hypothetical protein
VYFETAHHSCVWLGYVASRPEQAGSSCDIYKLRSLLTDWVLNMHVNVRERHGAVKYACTCPSDKSVSDGICSRNLPRMSYNNRRIRVYHDVLTDFSREHVMVQLESGTRVRKGQNSGDAG